MVLAQCLAARTFIITRRDGSSLPTLSSAWTAATTCLSVITCVWAMRCRRAGLLHSLTGRGSSRPLPALASSVLIPRRFSRSQLPFAKLAFRPCGSCALLRGSLLEAPLGVFARVSPAIGVVIDARMPSCWPSTFLVFGLPPYWPLYQLVRQRVAQLSRPSCCRALALLHGFSLYTKVSTRRSSATPRRNRPRQISRPSFLRHWRLGRPRPPRRRLSSLPRQAAPPPGRRPSSPRSNLLLHSLATTAFCPSRGRMRTGTPSRSQ